MFAYSGSARHPHWLANIEPHLQKHVSAVILTAGCVFTHRHSSETEHALLWGALWSFVVLPLVSIWKCYQPAGSSFPLWFLIQSLRLLFFICVGLQIDASISKERTSSNWEAQFALSSHQILHLDLSTCLYSSFPAMPWQLGHLKRN